MDPPLAWTGVPGNAQSLALIVEDRDAPDPAAPADPFVHWVVVDLPPDAGALPEGVTKLPGGRVWRNDLNHVAWDGPAPQIGKHRYVFKLFALDRELGLATPTKAELEAAMAGHILDQTRLTGTYRAR